MEGLSKRKCAFLTTQGLAKICTILEQAFKLLLSVAGPSPAESRLGKLWRYSPLAFADDELEQAFSATQASQGVDLGFHNVTLLGMVAVSIFTLMPVHGNTDLWVAFTIGTLSVTAAGIHFTCPNFVKDNIQVQCFASVQYVFPQKAAVFARSLYSEVSCIVAVKYSTFKRYHHFQSSELSSKAVVHASSPMF